MSYNTSELVLNANKFPFFNPMQQECVKKGFSKSLVVSAPTASGKTIVAELFTLETVLNENKKVISIEEKPKEPKSNYAVTGMYIYDNTVVAKSKALQPSDRGELEITDLNNVYLNEGTLDVAFVEGKWLDTGTFESLHEAIIFARDRELASNN